MDKLMADKVTVSDTAENIPKVTNDASVTALKRMVQKALNAKPGPIRQRALSAYFHGKHCGKCGYEFQPEEAVYRLRIFFGHDGFGYPDHHIAPICTNCRLEECRHISRVRTYSEPCGGCGRPVYQPTGFRNRRHSFCCRDCEIKLRNNLQAEKRRNRRRWARCSECRADFNPKRSDAEYCSAACKQKAYRKRQRF